MALFAIEGVWGTGRLVTVRLKVDASLQGLAVTYYVLQVMIIIYDICMNHIKYRTATVGSSA